MASSRRNITFSEGEWEAISTEASHLGLTTGQFVRSSAMARAGFALARRGGPVADHLASLFEATDELVRAYPDIPEGDPPE